MKDWRDAARCVGHDPELWFPVGSAGPALAQAAQAKAICAGCPVRAQCAALGEGMEFGIFGGLGPDERRARVAA